MSQAIGVLRPLKAVYHLTNSGVARWVVLVAHVLSPTHSSSVDGCFSERKSTFRFVRTKPLPVEGIQDIIEQLGDDWNLLVGTKTRVKSRTEGEK